MWRLLMARVRVLPALLALAACGGAVEGGSSQDPDEGAGDDGANGVSGSKNAPQTPTNNPDADTDLGDCKLGPPESRAADQQCAWVAGERCYQTREMACNCACPRSRNSQCASGFEAGPDGHVWVACN